MFFLQQVSGYAAMQSTHIDVAEIHDDQVLGYVFDFFFAVL